MTNEPSPRPWRVVDYAQCPGIADVFDASGSPSGLVAGELKPADAALIVAAVNLREYLIEHNRLNAEKVCELFEERDRLLDIVRRMLPLAETTVENIRALGTARFPFLEHIKSDRLRGDINREVENADYLLREARAALGEETR